MGQRVIRVNELVKREISEVLHTVYRGQTVDVTIIDVDVSPNLRNAKVYFSVLGDAARKADVGRFFAAQKKEIRRLIGKRIVLKYLPALEFIEDAGAERGAKLNAMLDEMGLVGECEAPTNNEEDEC